MLADLLFQPTRIGSMQLGNRVVMAPMTRSLSPYGVPGENVAAYYARRAANSVGLIITEGTVVGHPASSNDVNVPRFYGEDALAGWARVVKEVHAVDGHIAAQLWHVGSVRKSIESPNPEVASVSPSGLRKPGTPYGGPMSDDEIEVVVGAFEQAARAAQTLGFDAVEIHGAHGYLIDQFLWDAMNVRADRYGGSISGRARFATEVVKACRYAVGPEFPIIFRLSQWKVQDYTARLVKSPAELNQLITPLAEAGVDLFHCSTRRYWEPEFPGSELNIAGWVKCLSAVPTITVGSVGRDPDALLPGSPDRAPITRADRLIEMLLNAEVDLVAVGRPLLADPEWARKVRDGRIDETIPFTPEVMSRLY